MNRSNVMRAHVIFMELLQKGKIAKSDFLEMEDPGISELVESFANESKAVVISAGTYFYLIPIAQSCPYHTSNAEIRSFLSKSSATNIDMYMMYLCIIIFVGEFYNSYNSNYPTREFLTLSDWLNSVNERIESLSQIESKLLEELDRAYEYNWSKLIEYWQQLDILKEGKREQINTKSRKAFLNNVAKFMYEQELIEMLGNDELAPTTKLKVIVNRYFMDFQYNRGIKDLLYEYSNWREHGDHQ